MAAQQEQRHELGRQGETVAKQTVGGKTTKHKAPFDLIDFRAGYAYEVKTMSGYSKDLKIHISDTSMARKIKFAHKWGLEMVLIAVVVYAPDYVEVYKKELTQCTRVSQMTLVERRA